MRSKQLTRRFCCMLTYNLTDLQQLATQCTHQADMLRSRRHRDRAQGSQHKKCRRGLRNLRGSRYGAGLAGQCPGVCTPHLGCHVPQLLPLLLRHAWGQQSIAHLLLHNEQARSATQISQVCEHMCVASLKHGHRACFCRQNGLCVQGVRMCFACKAVTAI